MLSEFAQQVLAKMGAEYGHGTEGVRWSSENPQCTEVVSARLFEAICAASRAVGAGEAVLPTFLQEEVRRNVGLTVRISDDHEGGFLYEIKEYDSGHRPPYEPWLSEGWETFMPDVANDTQKVRCACGSEFMLWFNGGELDQKTCAGCGTEYRLAHIRIDVQRRATPEEPR